MKKKTKNEIDEVGVGTGQSGIRKGYPEKDQVRSINTNQKRTISIED